MSSSLKIVSTKSWDSNFFEKFRTLKNRLHKNEPYFFEETLKDLKLFFGASSPFHSNNDWQCWMIIQDDKPIARLGVSLPNYWKNPLFVPVGFYEAENVSADILAPLFKEAEAWAKNEGVKELRLPMQGGFFGSYRAKLPNSNIPLLGEPDTLSYYFTQWENLGFIQSGAWTTCAMNIAAMIKNSEDALIHFYKKTEIPNVVVRPVNVKNWKEELKIIRELFLDSFSKMPEFMPISEEEFLYFYDPLKFLAHPEFCFIVEHENKPIAFMLSFFDPTVILKNVEKKWGFLPKLLRDLIALPQIRNNRTRFIAPYSGKTQSSDKIKGVMALLLLKILKNNPPDQKDCFFAYIADGSPTYKTVTPETYKEYARYNLFKKVLS